MSDYFVTDASNNLILNDKGLVDINYGDINVAEYYQKDIIESGKKDLNILLSYPFAPPDRNQIFNYNSCKLNYLS